MLYFGSMNSDPMPYPSPSQANGTPVSTSEPRSGQTVLILDDDPAVSHALARLFSAHGYRTRSYQDFTSLLADGPPPAHSCLLLDHDLGPGLNGLEAYQQIRRLERNLPVIFLTGNWDVQLIVTAMKTGADGFLAKPFDPDKLLAEVAQSLQMAQNNHRASHEIATARALASELTPREEEIVRLVISGMLNKEIADALGLALVTVKVHRGRAMKKLKAGNPAELVRIARLAGISD